jgi:hypothetical protein
MPVWERRYVNSGRRETSAFGMARRGMYVDTCCVRREEK